tara:strand:+ start:894 stop:1493 length:600 start_codon:yes stop_codon:yes gene_type:complete
MKTYKELFLYLRSYIRYNEPDFSKIRRTIKDQVEMIGRTEKGGGNIPPPLMGLFANHNLDNAIKLTILQHHKEILKVLSESRSTADTIIRCLSDYSFNTKATKVLLKKLVEIYLPALEKLPVMDKIRVFCSIDKGSRRGLIAVLRGHSIITSNQLTTITNNSLTKQQAKAIMIMADITPLSVMPLTLPEYQPYFLNKIN